LSKPIVKSTLSNKKEFSLVSGPYFGKSYFLHTVSPSWQIELHDDMKV